MNIQRIPSALSLIAAAGLVACSAAPAASAPSAVATTAPTATAAPTASPTAVPVALSPKAAGFASTVLIERKRSVPADMPGYVRIAASAAGDAAAITTTLPEGESFAATYRAASARKDAAGPALYESADFPAVPAGSYTEGLRQIKVQPAGQSAAHKHPGFETVLVLEGTIQIRTASSGPQTLQKGQGFSILHNVPIQLFNVGTTMARTLVSSLTADGLPFSTELDTSP